MRQIMGRDAIGRAEYDGGRENLVSCSYAMFPKSAQRFLDVCSTYGPARTALEGLPTVAVDYDEVVKALEGREDPFPSDASQHLGFCLALLRVCATRSEDAAPLLGCLLSASNDLDDGLRRYRTDFLHPLLGYTDKRVALAETSRALRSEKLAKPAWFVIGAIAGGFLTKLGEWLWTRLCA